MRSLKFVLVLAALAAAAVIALRLIFPLPDLSGRPDSRALPASAETRLGRLMAQGQARHPGKSGVVPLADGNEALAARLALADTAQATIDAQYYIWHDDTSGILLLDALRRAARRGVRVRLLLDDNGIPGLDPYVAALNAEPNFEIRLFNPSTVRSPKMLGYAFDFFRMNRRMHNKSMLADGAAAIIGGRNIGDEYFQVGEDPFYVDLDVLATGAIVPETAATFDAYWNSASVFAADTILTGPGDPAGLAARISEIRAGTAARAFLVGSDTAIARHLDTGTALEWTDVQLVADDPVKGQGIARRDQLMISRLGAILGTVERRLDLVSAYFVPGTPGTAFFSDTARAGKEVNILTNALDTTDVLLVHSGYTKYRRALLEAGVHLWELKLRGTHTGADEQIMPLGLSGASLHAKTFAVDGARIFIGSFNFDPRSATLNCEMGFLIDSPAMADRVAGLFDGPLARAAYRPALTPEGRMVWQETLGADTRIYQEEPGATWAQQIALVFIGLLPVEWML